MLCARMCASECARACKWGDIRGLKFTLRLSNLAYKKDFLALTTSIQYSIFIVRSRYYYFFNFRFIVFYFSLVLKKICILTVFTMFFSFLFRFWTLYATASLRFVPTRYFWNAVNGRSIETGFFWNIFCIFALSSPAVLFARSRYLFCLSFELPLILLKNFIIDVYNNFSFILLISNPTHVSHMREL